MEQHDYNPKPNNNKTLIISTRDMDPETYAAYQEVLKGTKEDVLKFIKSIFDTRGYKEIRISKK